MPFRAPTAPGPRQWTSDAVWLGVDRLVERVPSLAEARRHRLHLLAAAHHRRLGREVLEALVLEELANVHRIASSLRVLRRLRAAYDGSIMVIKGLEVASAYPSRELRHTHDLDVLVDDAEAAYAAAVDSGLEPLGHPERYYSSKHHVRPLWSPEERSVVLEIHRRPNWVPWALAPSAGEVLRDAVPGTTGIDGLLAPRPAQHAVMVAAHSWGEVPLRRAGDLVDVAALLAIADPGEANETAQRWGLDRMWRRTLQAVEALLLGAPPPAWLRALAPDVLEIRDRTVFENHLRTLTAPVLALAPRPALEELRYVIRDEVAPKDGETWASRGRSVLSALRNAGRPTSEHETSRAGTAEDD